MFEPEGPEENPILNQHRAINFADDDDDEEIDVLNADESLGPEDDEFRPENIFMMGGAEEYDEEGMQYQEEVQFIGQYVEGQQYDGGVLGNSEAYNAHYLEEEFAVDEDYMKREFLAQIEPITTAERLAKYPEMQCLPPHRSKKNIKRMKKPNPDDGPVAKLLYAAYFKKADDKEKAKPTENLNIRDTKKFLAQQRLVAQEKKKKEVPPRQVMRKVNRPLPKEPKITSYVPMTPLPDRYFIKRVSLTAEQAGFISDCISCDLCHYMVRHKALMKSHKEKHLEKGAGEVLAPRAGLICPVKCCNRRSDSIATIIKHMRMSHGVPEFTFERIVFKDIEQFKNWKIELERLTLSRYCRTSGKRNVFSRSTYFQCHHSGEAPAAKMDQVRLRPSKKMGKTCTAFFHVRENDDGTVLLRGCTKHSGHDADVRNLPLTEEIKMEIATLLIEGFDENTIVAKMRALSDNKNRRYYLQNYEVRNVATKVERYKEEYKRKQQNHEPIPNLSVTEIISRRRQNEQYPSRAKLACSRFPIDVAYQQGYEEVEEYYEEQEVIEDGEFNIPSVAGPSTSSAPLVERFRGKVNLLKTSPRKSTPKKRKLDDEDYEEEEEEQMVEPNTPRTRFSSRLQNKQKVTIINEEIIDVVGGVEDE